MGPATWTRSPVVAGLAAAICAVAIGIGAALAASPASLSMHAGSHGKSLAAAQRPAVISPSAIASPAPPTSAGRLGDDPVLMAGRGWVVASGKGGTFESSDSGAAWQAVNLPAGAAGLVIDPRSAAHRLTGGPALLESQDGGKSWQPARTQPPGPGPFTPMAINPTDSGVWFVSAHGAIIRTRDSAVSWKGLTGLPPIADALLLAFPGGDRFFLAVGGRVFDLKDNGNQIAERQAMPAGVTITQLSLSGAVPALLSRGSDGKSYRDPGDGWAVMPTSGPVTGVSRGRAWVAGGGAKLGAPGRISYSDDSGQRWSEATGIPTDQTVDAISPLDAEGTNVLAYGYGGDLFGSDDGGHTWQKVKGNLRAG